MFSLVQADTSSWVRELCRVFKECQLNVLDDKYVPIGDDIAVPWTLQHLMATVEFIQTIDRPAGSAAEWWKLYHRVAGDVRKGASMRMGMVSVIGQKPPTLERKTDSASFGAVKHLRSRL